MLSSRAEAFLLKQERYPSTVSRQDIIDCLKANDAPVFEPLIEFQQNYGGYKFKAGLELIHFRLLQGDGGFPVSSGTAVIDYNTVNFEFSKYRFVCATHTDIPIYFIDEFGNCFQHDVHHIVASSFEKVIEHWAIGDEINTNSDLNTIFENVQLDVFDLDKRLNLKMVVEASDAYTLWFKNDSTYLQQQKGLSTLFSSKSFNEIKPSLTTNKA